MLLLGCWVAHRWSVSTACFANISIWNSGSTFVSVSVLLCLLLASLFFNITQWTESTLVALLSRKRIWKKKWKKKKPPTCGWPAVWDVSQPYVFCSVFLCPQPFITPHPHISETSVLLRQNLNFFSFNIYYCCIIVYMLVLLSIVFVQMKAIVLFFLSDLYYLLEWVNEWMIPSIFISSHFVHV